MCDIYSDMYAGFWESLEEARSSSRKVQTDGGIPRNNSPAKNEQHFPLYPQPNSNIGAGSEDLCGFSIGIRIHSRASASEARGPRRPKKKNKKKNLGREKQKRACEKKGLRGQRKTPPPQQKALDAVRPRVPVTLWQTKEAVKNPEKEGTNPPP